MRRGYLVILLPLLVVALAGSSSAWQGRMAGMGDPYGLMQDESDFLVHPAKIAAGEGVKFYGDYRFTYTGVTRWDITLYSDAAGSIEDDALPGDKYRHEALLGAAFPLGPGRMGLFYAYDGKRGLYDGNVNDAIAWNQRDDLDNFAFKVMYGVPLGSFKLGGEAQIAYRQEEHKSFEYDIGGTDWWLNDEFNYLYGLTPYDSSYGEALFKGSLEGKVGPLDLAFTVRGGFAFAGANKWDYKQQVAGIVSTRYLDGGVDGWRIGGDLWVRYPLGDGLVIPFLVRVDYQTKTRDGDGTDQPGGTSVDYQDKAKGIEIEVGGGVDKKFNTMRLAAGIYYRYLRTTDDVSLHYDDIPGMLVEDNCFTVPHWTEHQGIIRIAGEWELTPTVSLRMGLTPFLGWAKKKTSAALTQSINLPLPPIFVRDTLIYEEPREGFHWGIGASLGSTIKFKRLTVEPFVNGGYQSLKMSGNGSETEIVDIIIPPLSFHNVTSSPYDVDESRDEWFIGGGFSILYDL